MSSLAVFYKELPWGRSRWTYGFHVICRRSRDNVFAAVHFYDQQGDKLFLIDIEQVKRKDSYSHVNMNGITHFQKTETRCKAACGWDCDANGDMTLSDLKNDREVFKVIVDSIEMALLLQVPTPEKALSHDDFAATVAHVKEQIGRGEDVSDESDGSDASYDSYESKRPSSVKTLWKIFRGAVNA